MKKVVLIVSIVDLETVSPHNSPPIFRLEGV